MWTRSDGDAADRGVGEVPEGVPARLDCAATAGTWWSEKAMSVKAIRADSMDARIRCRDTTKLSYPEHRSRARDVPFWSEVLVTEGGGRQRRRRKLPSHAANHVPAGHGQPAPIGGVRRGPTPRRAARSRTLFQSPRQRTQPASVLTLRDVTLRQGLE